MRTPAVWALAAMATVLLTATAQAQESPDDDSEPPAAQEQQVVPATAPVPAPPLNDATTTVAPVDADNPLKKEEARVATGVRLRALNKVTARSSVIEGDLNKALEFGDLTITAKSCLVSPAAKRPEQAALLEIIEKNPDTGTRTLFSGWMFASSPALSALEHPVYDITVLSCKE